MANKYPGYCVDCGREVRSGHGNLVKRGAKWVVSCGRAQKAAVNHVKPARPTGMRLSDLRFGSANAALVVRFRVNGVGIAEAFPDYAAARAVKYTRWSNEPLKSGEHAGKSLRELQPDQAARNDEASAANEALRTALEGQIASESKYEFSFLLSEEEQSALAKFEGDAKATLLGAILDGTAEITVADVGCDYLHSQITRIRVAGEDIEYALIQRLLSEFRLEVDGTDACEDLAAAIRSRQEAQAKVRAALEEHRALRAAGRHVVLLRRCWECGRTEIEGEYDDAMHLVRMAPDVYQAARAAQNDGHRRSLAAAGDQILSSVGFDPAPESKFEFRVSGKNWYCGC